MCELCECMCLVLNDDCMEGCCMITRLCDILRCDLKPCESCCCCKGRGTCCNEDDEDDETRDKEDYQDSVVSQQPSSAGKSSDTPWDETNEETKVISSEPKNDVT
ncbi:uncharacterized protein LOC122267434 isoform X2 [Penaeus japonicus]|uniref:uncharacterized protein LOC122267434 isoform X2 n=1 Tax=Penaeus japonicus TaxID=27405 RepID=UPI001C70E592|nr:uncharacterized protein LOC122267434 isoform X2 [Penaeus japonicus]